MIRLLAVCPFLAATNRESLKTDKILEKLVMEVENGYPRLEKVSLIKTKSISFTGTQKVKH
jgi:hypothetical protein